MSTSSSTTSPSTPTSRRTPPLAHRLQEMIASTILDHLPVRNPTIPGTEAIKSRTPELRTPDSPTKTPDTPSPSSIPTDFSLYGLSHCGKCRQPHKYDHVLWARGLVSGYTCRCHRPVVTAAAEEEIPKPPKSWAVCGSCKSFGHKSADCPWQQSKESWDQTYIPATRVKRSHKTSPVKKTKTRDQPPCFHAGLHRLHCPLRYSTCDDSSVNNLSFFED